MIQIGNDKIKDIYVGSDNIKEVYYGSELVWGEIEYIQDGYWVHKDTGVKTYFGLEDPSITDGIMSEPSWKNDCSEVNIPVGVTSLGDNCFAECHTITSITLPESLTSLGWECFFGCVSLTSITIPENVTSIGAYCFIYCNALTLATVLPATPPTLGGDAFFNVGESFSIKVRPPYVDYYKTATNWTSYADKISAIGAGYWVHKDTGVRTYFDADADFIMDEAMHRPPWAEDCSEVHIPEGVTLLRDECFASCKSLTSITIPESVISIENACFYGCSSLTSITIPESVEVIGGYCFMECTSLTLVTVLPTTPPSLGTGAFDYTHESFNIQVNSPYVNDYKTATNWVEYADKILAIPVPGYWIHKDTGIKTDFGTDADFITDGVMSNPSWAYDCSEVKIPSGVTGLGYACFQGSLSLTTITIPDSVTSLGNGCFSTCSSLTSIYSLGSTAPGLSGSPFGDFSPGNGEYTGRNTYNQGVNMLYVPQGATGYDASYWLDPLQDATKCGFTISYTL